jgi:hemerythrin superfamily protein
MDALDLLKADHERVKSLYEQFKSENGRQQQILLFENIRNELLAHAQIEETVFYPAFKNYPDFKQIIDQSYADHQKVKNELKAISALPDNSPELVNKVETVMADVQKHINDEEGELFAMVRKIMRRNEREQLGRHLQAAKQEASGAGVAA